MPARHHLRRDARADDSRPPSRGGVVVHTGLTALDERGEDATASPAEACSLAAALAAGYGAQAPGPRTVRARPGRRTSRSSTATALPWRFPSTLGSGSGVFRHGFQLNNMLGELDVIGAGSARSQDLPAEHDGADPRAGRRRATARRERGVRSARGRDPPSGRGRSFGRACRSRRRSRGLGSMSTARPPMSKVAGRTAWPRRWPRTASTRSHGRARTPSSEAHPPSSDAEGGVLGAAGDPAARRPRVHRPMIAIRPAEPGDASELVSLAAKVGREPGTGSDHGRVRSAATSAAT